MISGGPTSPQIATDRAPELPRAAIALLVICGLLSVTVWITSDRITATVLSDYFLINQDILLAIFLAIALVAANALRLPSLLLSEPLIDFRHVLFLSVILGLVCYAGHYFLLEGYDLSRDEQLAVFDSRIFSAGELVAPLAKECRDNIDALNTMFLLEVPDNGALVSNYLPVGAMVRALVGLFVDPALANPIFVGLGAVTLWAIVRKLWPGDRSAALIAMVLYAGSGQILFNGMTAYAMTGHLALNLVWIWLFLRERLAADIGALVIGFAATGLHQPVFHPLFAAPFIVMLFFRRDYRRLALYVVGYGLIAAFWSLWPIWMSAIGGQGAAGANEAGFTTRLAYFLGGAGPADIRLMILNMVRYFTWQHALALPLLVLGMRAAWRENDFARALIISFLTPLPAMLVLSPYQGHGWGYRYLHGEIGPAILIAVYGWKSLRFDEHRRMALVTVSTAATLLLMMPAQAYFMHGIYAPYARMSHEIDKADADYAIIGNHPAPFSDDLANNRPDLSNRPLRLLQTQVTAETVARICKNGASAVFIGYEDMEPMRAVFGAAMESHDEELRAFEKSMTLAGCRRVSWPPQ